MSQEGIIDIIGTHPEIPIYFIADVGSASPIANTLEILATTQAAGTTPAHTTGSGNTITTIIQLSQAIGVTNALNVGLAAFDSSHFNVDANGFVTLVGSGTVESFNVDAHTAPGTDPVTPDGSGIVTITGGQVAAGGIGTNVIQTNSLAANTYTIQIQRSTTAAVSTLADNGVSHFSSAQFSVDANGFVTLAGGTTAPILGLVPDAHTGPGTSPVIPNGSGNIIVTAGTVAAGTTPIRTDSLAANTIKTEVQISQAIAATDATKIGLSNFNSAFFTVDANGFVGGTTITGSSGGALSPTAANFTFAGASPAAGTTPVAVAGSVSTFTVNVQKSQAIASTDATKIGLSNFNSAQFTVDANGFVSLSGSGGFAWSDVSGAFSPLKENGYFVTGTATGTLPATPAQGDTIKFFVDHASQVLTIQASGTQLIRFSTSVSSAGGTAISSQQGDSCELVYRASNTTWQAVCGFTGGWNLA